MARRGTRKQEHEHLDDATLGRVVSLLNQEKPITKKVACEILNISYNTSRLNRIIEEYKSKLEHKKKRFAMNRGKPFSELELKELVSDYLNGESISSIADNLYRSPSIIKRKIQELNLPVRTKKSTYQNPDIIPDEAVSEKFEVGELVWAARYNAVAEIRGCFEILNKDTTEEDRIYRLFIFGKHNEFAYQPWWELGKLEAVKKYNLETEDFIKTEKPNFAYRID